MKGLLRNIPSELREYYHEIIQYNGISAPLYCPKTESLNGLIKLLYTTAIVTDVGQTGYHQRFCFEFHPQALAAHCAWHKKSFDPHFLPRGWIACRGVSKQELIDGYPAGYGHEVIEAYRYIYTCEPKLHADVVAKKPELAREIMCSENTVKHLAAYLQAIDILV